jgi:hypothetical protein
MLVPSRSRAARSAEVSDEREGVADFVSPSGATHSRSMMWSSRPFSPSILFVAISGYFSLM